MKISIFVAFLKKKHSMNKMKTKNLWGALLCIALSLVSCRPGYEVVKVEGSRVAMDSVWDEKPSEEMVELVASYRTKIDSIMSRVVGTADMSMGVERPESLLSNLVADVLREAAGQVTGQAIDMGLVNMGGLRSVLTQGAITCGEIYEILPFENSLCVLTLKGTHMKQLFENIAARGGEGVSGVRLSLSSDGRLLDAAIGGKAVEEDRLYTVATIDYLADGNDGLTALIQAEKRECPPGATLRKLFFDYVEKQTAAGHALTSRIEGRITIDR